MCSPQEVYKTIMATLSSSSQNNSISPMIYSLAYVLGPREKSRKARDISGRKQAEKLYVKGHLLASMKQIIDATGWRRHPFPSPFCCSPDLPVLVYSS